MSLQKWLIKTLAFVCKYFIGDFNLLNVQVYFGALYMFLFVDMTCFDFNFPGATFEKKKCSIPISVLFPINVNRITATIHQHII